MTRRAKPQLPDDPATAYARAVTDGAVVAGPHIRAACKRHLRDLAAGRWKWDLEAVRRVLGYFPDVLRLAGGEHEGKPFKLEPWQAFTVASLFGWKGPDGFRRFRMAYVEAGKGSGKSPLAAGIGLYMATADSEPRAELYAAASKKDQAMVCFRDAVAMVRQSKPLLARASFSGGPGREWNIAFPSSGSFFRPISSDDGQSGPRPHGAILDEVHEHRDNQMVELLRAGTKGRRQALILMITNSGADRTGVCFDYHDYACKVASGAVQDEAFFGLVFGLDEGDDPFAEGEAGEACWPKANPSLGVTIRPQYLRELVTQARGMPSKEAIVRRLNFCEWTDALQHWIGRDLWEAVQVPAPDTLEHLRGLPCWLGLDLSQKRDLTALAGVWRLPDGTLEARLWFWTPRDTLDERAKMDRVDYRAWERAGHINAEPGRIIAKESVARFVQELCAEHDVQALAYDQAQMDDFLAALDNIGLDAWIYDGEDARPGDGLRLHRHGQGFAGYQSDKALWMPRSVAELEERVVRGTIRIHENPCLTWNSASAVLDADPSGNRKWDKRKATGRIDGMVALTMAVGAAAGADEETGTSIWDKEELWA